MRIELSTCVLRPWALADAPALARHANSREIWRNLRDGFPHPYTERHAREWLARVIEAESLTHFAVTVDDEAIGSIGFRPGHDVERVSAEIGYWLGEPFWGRGIMTDAVRGATRHALARPDLLRVFAVPFAGNARSSRVLEKAGYQLEGRLRRSAVKDGVVVDQLLYAAYAPA